MLDLFNYQNPPRSFAIKVTPGAKTERVKQALNQSGELFYKIYVKALAIHGQANKAIIALIAKELGVSVSHVHIIHGHTEREKRVLVTCA